jgi:hypothetical protein
MRALPFLDRDQAVLGLGGNLDLPIDVGNDLLNRVVEEFDGHGTLASGQVLSLFAQEGASVLDVIVHAGLRDSEFGDERGVGGTLASALPNFGGALESPFDLAGDGDACFR